MPVITIVPVAVVANVEKDSAARTLAGSVNSVSVQLTDSAGNATPAGNSNWLHTAGNVKQWGIQCSMDGGATWQWGPVFQGDVNDSSTWIAFGALGRNGKLPSLTISGDALVEDVGAQLRLAVVTDANITLGAVVTTG